MRHKILYNGVSGCDVVSCTVCLQMIHPQNQGVSISLKLIDFFNPNFSGGFSTKVILRPKRYSQKPSFYEFLKKTTKHFHLPITFSFFI